MREKKQIKISFNTLIFIIAILLLINLAFFFILNNNKYNNKETRQIDGGTVLDAISSGKILSYENSTKLVDKNNNFIIIPKGFRVLNENNATTVDKGIVIEDIDGNQYVWVPVGTINTNGNQKVEIILGRYDYSTINEFDPKPIQKATLDDFLEKKIISGYYYEKTKSESILESIFDTITINGYNKTENLKKFISSTLNNGGYYIGRYESGINEMINTTNETYIKKDGKDLGSKDDANNKNISLGIKSGIGVWNCISKKNAEKVSRKIYNNGVNTDLINSYAWDTAVMFIEKCGENNNLSYNNQCNIFDMSSNIEEWTTESSTYYNQIAIPAKYKYVKRGPATERISSYGSESEKVGFRVILYI